MSNKQIRDRINKELVEFDSPAGFKAVYKLQLLLLFKDKPKPIKPKN